MESLKTQMAVLAQGNTPIMSIASSTAATAPTAPVSGSDIPVFASTRSFASATVSSAVSSAGSGVQNMSSSERENTPDIVDRGVLTAYDADCLIQRFMVNFVPAFPFVSLDAAQTSLDLRHKYPFLFLCIVAVTMEKPELHCGTLREEIMKQITFRLIKKAQRNMDLLRGPLVYCAWYQNHHHEEKSQVILSLQLCLTLCYDMDLERKKILTAEEQRAFLGTYWLSVGLSRAMQKPIGMKYGKQVEEASRDIGASGGRDSDRWIRPLITLQSFASRLDNSYNSLDDSNSVSNGGPAIHIISESYIFQLDSVKRDVEKELACCHPSAAHVLRQEILFIEMSIREIALQDRLQMHTKWYTYAHSQSPTVQISALYQLIKSGSAFLADFLSIPDKDLLYLPFTIYSRLCCVLFIHATAAWSLLEAVASRGRTRAHLSLEQIAEAQLIIDEADYVGFTTALLTKLDGQTFNCLSTTKDNNIAAQFATKMRVLAYCYPAQIKTILGIDLAAKSSVSIRAETTVENTLVDPQPDGVEDTTEWHGWQLPVPQAEDGTALFDEEMWTSVMNAFDWSPGS